MTPAWAWPRVALLVALAAGMDETGPARPGASDPTPWFEPLNLGFEKGLRGWAGGGRGYAIRADAVHPHSGQWCLRLDYLGARRPGPQVFGAANRTFPVELVRGRRLTLTGWIRTSNLTGGWAGLWMRVDGPKGAVLAIDNMQDRGVNGTTPWARYEVVLDVSAQARAVYFGPLLAGGGTAWFDDLDFALSVPLLALPVGAGRDQTPERTRSSRATASVSLMNAPTLSSCSAAPPAATTALAVSTAPSQPSRFQRAPSTRGGRGSGSVSGRGHTFTYQ